jgi:hypothetical protein
MHLRISHLLLPQVFIRRCFIFLGKLLALSVLLTSCSSAPDLGAISMACAAVEDYQSDKALALVDAINGGSALESVKLLVSPIEGVPMDSAAKSIYDSFLNSMTTWGRAVDISLKSGLSLSIAAEVLEEDIDSIAESCEGAGWKFETGWR